ncbi:hypothetical protein [Dyella sp. Tek66A03]|uniref:hypothetical protein n=1 Tax=Dyella sp. Tek66A03 TaxID=3458298 RepID=UPI00403E43A1
MRLTTQYRHARSVKQLYDDFKKQGKNMTDTIDLLVAIGQDASLRHASTDDLADMLEQAQASEALTAAVASGDSTRLAEEFGQKLMLTPQISQSPGHEDEEPEQEDEDAPQPPPSTDLG